MKEAEFPLKTFLKGHPIEPAEIQFWKYFRNSVGQFCEGREKSLPSLKKT